jgi:hypothetical protein
MGVNEFVEQIALCSQPVQQGLRFGDLLSEAGGLFAWTLQEIEDALAFTV